MNAPKRHPARGFSYLEILVALLVLGMCAVPAADAMRSGANAAQVAAAKALELRCMKSHMELVLAEPYARLAGAARQDNAPAPAYTITGQADCIDRYVFIARYERPYGGAEKLLTDLNSSALERDNAMLRIIVSPSDLSLPEPASSSRGYTLTTLVIR